MVKLTYIEKKGFTQNNRYDAGVQAIKATGVLEAFYNLLPSHDQRGFNISSGIVDTLPSYFAVPIKRKLEKSFNPNIHPQDPVIAVADYRLNERINLNPEENQTLDKLMEGISMVPL
ncbi:hypothetical protein HOE37_02610 [Candidatus Woesearchaeota archaeon]|jgi:hypothetical protein|nr:hypothetical protein [Candidatus Woesearchaeota archaeon]MBT4110724.1 hypothetical protein [Candidatus Woesearchaeota archaeon]MBT4336320.1 hypothetical protein [Candidatus Woesearchaeota archaeon]MBT4469319.1 hypothetical protein [Candidatus Woesearchaeota archaeon]MBT6743858.1 hypothetical protein [Candidatus Woesearchaeota archaeon]